MTGALVLALFFASGFAALTYQVIWQRLLTLATGLDLPAVTVIVAVFLAGIGLGNLAGGALADRFRPAGRFVAFAAAELLIAGFALASPWLLGEALQSGAAASLGSRGALLVGGVLLLVPTFCMGVTLPLLARTETERLPEVPRWVGGLYGWNTLGAAAGASLGTALLVRAWGYGGGLAGAAALNVTAAAVALWLARRATAPVGARGPAIPAVATDSAGAAGTSLRNWYGLYFLSGFIALSLELVWFRILGVALKSTAFTFPLLLTAYLAGVGAGSLLTRDAAAASREPMRAFLSLQAAIPLYAAFAVSVLALSLGTLSLPGLGAVEAYFASYEPIPFSFDFRALSPGQRALYLGLPALLVLVPTLLMGASFPYLQRAVHSNLATVGQRVGQLQAANIAGCVLGVVLTGAVFLGTIGTTGTLRLLVLLGAPFLWLLASNRGAGSGRELARGIALLLPVGVALVIPGQAMLWSTLHGATPDRVIYSEDATGLSVLTNERSDFRGPTTVFVNGIGQSYVPFGGGHTTLGLVPALLHPAPLDVAVIGLGSGDTLYASAARAETRRIDSIEINGAQLPTLRELHARTGYGGLGRLLDDDRIRQVTGDGRRHLLDATRRYDVIEADALRPTSAFAGNLYSLEYFQLLRRRLKPGGLAVTWVPTGRTLETFRAVFPHVARFDFVLVGSNEPIILDREEVLRRARSPALQQHFLAADLNIAPYVAGMLSDYRPVPHNPLADPSELNSDLFPRDELGVP